MSEELKIKQMQAAQMMVNGFDTQAIVSELNICATTLYRWKKLPEFKEYVGKAITDKTNLRIAHLIDDSFTALSAAVSTSADHSVRLKAALSVLKIFRMEKIQLPWMDKTNQEYVPVGLQLQIPEPEPHDDRTEKQPHVP